MVQCFVKGLQEHPLGNGIVHCFRVADEFSEIVITAVFATNQTAHLDLVLKKGLIVVCNIPSGAAIGVVYFVCDRNALNLAGGGIVGLDDISFLRHFLISF